MQLLVLILNKTDLLEDILKELVDAGIKGATILDSMGMMRCLNCEDSKDVPIFGSLKMLMNEKRPFNKTVFVVLKEEQLSPAITAIKKVMGDLTKPDVGIVFTLPIDYVEGIAK